MKIKALKKDWEINPITFIQRRKLHALHSQCYAPAVLNQSNEIEWNKYYDAIEMALKIAFIKPETTVEGLNDAEIDTLGQAIIQKYLVIEKKANGGVV
tara:strand:- start:3522 stop:3815 length:294 start_codon:yes stop_codon:yes gene_type:complete